MTQTSSGGSTVIAEQRRPGRGYALVLLTSLALGVVGIIPLVLAGYAVEQLLLAPLDPAPVDPTNNDGPASSWSVESWPAPGHNGLGRPHRNRCAPLLAGAPQLDASRGRPGLPPSPSSRARVN